MLDGIVEKECLKELFYFMNPAYVCKHFYFMMFVLFHESRALCLRTLLFYEVVICLAIRVFGDPRHVIKY